MKVVICSAKNSITDACSTADCLVNLVERMKRQRMKGQRMKRQRMKMQQMKRQRMKRQRMKTVTDWPKCFCIYRFKCSKAISGWMVGWLSDCTYSKSTCDAIIGEFCKILISLRNKLSIDGCKKMKVVIRTTPERYLSDPSGADVIWERLRCFHRSWECSHGAAHGAGGLGLLRELCTQFKRPTH